MKQTSLGLTIITYSFSCFFPCLFIYLFPYAPVLYKFSFLVLFISYIMFLFSKISYPLSVFITFISFSISLIFYIICAVAVGLLFGFIHLNISQSPSSYPYTFSAIIIGITQTVSIYNLLKNSHFRKGVSRLTFNRASIRIVSYALIFVLFIIIISTYKHLLQSITHTIINILVLILSLLLLYYWRRRIKQTYIENLRRLEILTYENTITEKDKQIKELEENNTHLGQIIHKYTKVIPAMELSVMELLQNNENLNNEELKQKAESLQTQLETLQSERDNLLDKYQKGTIITTQTGLHTVDAMLALMEKRAKQEWIRYKTHLTPNIRELALSAITEADLLHLLGDLVENALHAVRSSDNKDILIHFGKMNNCFLLEISDSGVAFDIQTYQNFGNEPYTSHKENGGSGIGLMDIWKIKKEYKASLYIYEYEANTNIYTKKISFLFDGKNHFLLKTYRDKEVKNALIRGDLHVFSYDSSNI